MDLTTLVEKLRRWSAHRMEQQPENRRTKCCLPIDKQSYKKGNKKLELLTNGK